MRIRDDWRKNRTTIFVLLTQFLTVLVPMKVCASEKSIATFKVENVGPVDRIKEQTIGLLPRTNELSRHHLIVVGTLIILFFFIIVKLKKGCLHEK